MGLCPTNRGYMTVNVLATPRNAIVVVSDTAEELPTRGGQSETTSLGKRYPDDDRVVEEGALKVAIGGDRRRLDRHGERRRAWSS